MFQKVQGLFWLGNVMGENHSFTRKLVRFPYHLTNFNEFFGKKCANFSPQKIIPEKGQLSDFWTDLNNFRALQPHNMARGF